MRYTEIDLQCEDIMWFGVDANGHILAFTSGGCGGVPEFVCRSKEETEQLEKFFLEEAVPSSEGCMKIPADGTPLSDDARMLSQKGLFIYDVSFDEGHTDEYALIAEPVTPLHINNLPKNIAVILRDHMIEGYAAGLAYLRVRHAY